MELFPDGFEPSQYDVLCGRGRTCKLWKGNLEYRKLVTDNLEAYSAAKSRLDKGAILNCIIDQVRQRSPDGGFVKKDPMTGRWYEVGDFLAREKTSQYFRDALHEQYSSSAQAKYNRRKSEEARKRASTTKQNDSPIARRVSENEATSRVSYWESTTRQVSTISVTNTPDFATMNHTYLYHLSTDWGFTGLMSDSTCTSMF